ncbi:phage-tail assembly protein [Salmonella bongori]|nr:phage-tail assembly protein [Salmonella bongori]
MLLSVLAVGCNSSSQQYNGNLQEVKPAGFPLLPQQARQKAETGILLAQLLGEADDLAGKFAKEADERYVAGSTCERTWDKVTGQK